MKRVTVNDYARLLLSVTRETAGLKLDETVRKVLDLMHARGDAALASRLTEAVESVSQATGDVTVVHVTTATGEDHIKAAVAKALGRREEEVNVTVNPSLVAGATVQVGYTVIDASLAGTLRRLSTHLSQ